MILISCVAISTISTVDLNVHLMFQLILQSTEYLKKLQLKDQEVNSLLILFFEESLKKHQR